MFFPATSQGAQQSEARPAVASNFCMYASEERHIDSGSEIAFRSRIYPYFEQIAALGK
jgi:hypothetical protein